MRRTRRRTRRRRRRQRGGFFGALTEGFNKGLAAVGLKKKEEEGDDEIKRTHASHDLSQPSNVDAAPAQEGGRRRRRRSRRRRRKSRKSRKSRRRRRRTRRRSRRRR